MPNNPLDSRLDWDPLQGKDWTASNPRMDEIIRRITTDGLAMVDLNADTVLSESDIRIDPGHTGEASGSTKLYEQVRHNIEQDIKRMSATKKAASQMLDPIFFNDAPKDRVNDAPVGLQDLFEAYNDEHHAYHELARVLVDAYEQAAIGKGKERHANDRAFRDQPIHRTSDLLQSDDGLNFQIIKKIEEAKRLSPQAAYNESLGAIVYTSAVAMRYQSRIESGEAQ